MYAINQAMWHSLTVCTSSRWLGFTFTRLPPTCSYRPPESPPESRSVCTRLFAICMLYSSVTCTLYSSVMCELYGFAVCKVHSAVMHTIRPWMHAIQLCVKSCTILQCMLASSVMDTVQLCNVCCANLQCKSCTVTEFYTTLYSYQTILTYTTAETFELVAHLEGS